MALHSQALLLRRTSISNFFVRGLNDLALFEASFFLIDYVLVASVLHLLCDHQVTKLEHVSSDEVHFRLSNDKGFHSVTDYD